MSETRKIKPVEAVTKAINKKGEIKGKNKKETKMLKAICPHHKYNKHGKLKPTIYNDSKGSCYCRLCGQKFPSKLLELSEVKDMVEGLEELNSQAKFTSVAIGAGASTVEYYAQLGAALSTYKKSYGKLKEVAERQNKVKTKKNKKNSGGSNQYGSWK